ncbi:MAG: hypothetical protein C7B46_15365 [Sulfobacillus benefaciens]|uniref:Uncharacterized protein n=1 Tax=Sulfobacillus benefaciens TaxID=453960 RepID=A0A2T2XCE9_9FIRM|nr:MAG: hypothetical protein C7B46_15365 [Sulfobacillus benefaciens]
MSHFLTLVLVPSSTPRAKIFDAVAALLAPFDENVDVDAYPVDCACRNGIAERAGRVAADREVGSLSALRARYRALPFADRPEWTTFSAAYQAVVERVAHAHPLYQQPDPQCDDCQGTGTRLSMYNPDSQWDWWAIGGWDGSLHPDNVLPVRDLLVSWASHAHPTMPFAVVTPDGQWHQHAVNAVSADDWGQTVRMLLQADLDALAVTCDLHI